MVQSGKKSAKGTVSVESVDGRLRLRFPRSLFGGTQKRLRVGLSDTPDNRKLAEAKAKEAEDDILYDRFDFTLNKYQVGVKAVTDNVVPFERAKLGELWDRYLEGRERECSPSTLYKSFAQYTRYVEKLPTHDLRKAEEIRDWVVSNIPAESAKRFLTRLAACCREAVKAGLIPENPFENMAAEVRIPKGKRKADAIEAFTAEERDLILEAFRTNQYCSRYARVKHSHYYPYVWFQFYTGCRDSEAIGLTWDCISQEFTHIEFKQAAVQTKNGIQLKQGGKTQEKRTFPCNEQMKTFLVGLKPNNPKPTDLVFPSPTGTFIDVGNFGSRVWKPIINGLGIKYRNPYCTRHTFITLCLEKGVDAKDISRLCGNSAVVIYQHYAGKMRSVFVPEL
ncbi:MAG TPA: tyrosine-type recombinase/integrase [Leptolyngbyaceae cyanobacterium]